jgi:uncharacterized membrane protein YhaH (DUF805 family)
MGPIDAIKAGLKKTFQFQGRASRSEFWWLVLFAAVVMLTISILEILRMLPSSHTLGDTVVEGTNRLIAVVLLGVPVAACGYRRLQDVSEDGYLILIPITTYVILWLIGNGPYSITLANGNVIGIGASSLSLSLSVWSLIILAMTACSLLLCYRLTWASDSGSNPFGPTPNEVPS